jgi:hypothetical protein
VGVIHVLFCAETISNVGCALLLAKTCSRSLDAAVDDIAVVALAT